MLAKGSKGHQVEALQLKLQTLGYLAGKPDGDFGNKTKAAVVAFQQAYLVDGIADDVTLDTLDKAIDAWAQAEKDLLIKVPIGYKELEQEFGTIVYDNAEGGNIVIVNDWADQHIAKVELPVVGLQLIHAKMEPVFKSVLQEIKDKGLDGEILQFGCWCPRHKMHDPNRGLSTHSWAISCDINWATNPVGRVGDLNPAIVDTFERHGFEWGGRWRTRDDMHFQYCKGY
jgi:hypothetical protein